MLEYFVLLSGYLVAIIINICWIIFTKKDISYLCGKIEENNEMIKKLLDLLFNKTKESK